MLLYIYSLIGCPYSLKSEETLKLYKPKIMKVSQNEKDKYKKMNKFLDKCKNVHGNKYDYSLVNYINNKMDTDNLTPFLLKVKNDKVVYSDLLNVIKNLPFLIEGTHLLKSVQSYLFGHQLAYQFGHSLYLTNL